MYKDGASGTCPEGRRNSARRPLHFLYKILWQFKIIKGSQSLYCTGFGAKPQTEVIGLKTVAVFQTAAAGNSAFGGGASGRSPPTDVV